MVVKKRIVASLARLDREYQRALVGADVTMAVYLSKLATIEYCGWLEETMDAVIFAFAKGRLKTNGFKDSLAEKVRGTYGFQYRKHFRPMLIHLVGSVRCERIQLALDATGDLSTLEAELDLFVVHRNTAAHTHVGSVLPVFPSPSVASASLSKVYPILRTLYSMRKDSRYV